MDIELDQLPRGAILRDVEAKPAPAGGRRALCVALTPTVRTGKPGVDFVDQPTFVLLPETMRDGVIEVELLARLLPDAPDYARGFIGLAYRILGVGEQYELVYLRPANGLRMNPPPPRDARAVQYYAYPDWKFDRLREQEPQGGYESGADIGLDEWIALRVELDGTRLRALVDGRQVLELRQTKVGPAEGRIGLWVDIGTEGYFANLRVEPR